MFTEVHILLVRIRAALERLRRDEGGYSTEAVLVTALLVALAIAVIAVIAIEVKRKADSINL
jgi:hypothetical protein